MNPHLDDHEEGLRFAEMLRDLDERFAGPMRLTVKIRSKYADADEVLPEHQFDLGTLSWDLYELVRLAVVGKVFEGMTHVDHE